MILADLSPDNDASLMRMLGCLVRRQCLLTQTVAFEAPGIAFSAFSRTVMPELQPMVVQAVVDCPREDVAIHRIMTIIPTEPATNANHECRRHMQRA